MRSQEASLPSGATSVEAGAEVFPPVATPDEFSRLGPKIDRRTRSLSGRIHEQKINHACLDVQLRCNNVRVRTEADELQVFGIKTTPLRRSHPR
jgi:hypothetical protein